MSDFIKGGDSVIIKIVFSKEFKMELSIAIIKSIFLFSFLGTL